MKINRRNFFAKSSGLLFSLASFCNIRGCLASDSAFSLAESKLPEGNNILVVISLAGGNDWLNTVIPYKTASYYYSRPTLAVAAPAALELDQEYAFHPDWLEMKKLYDLNKIAVLLNAGHLPDVLSHHRANNDLQYWHENLASGFTWQGYYANYMRERGFNKLIFPVINVEPKFFRGHENEIYSRERIFLSALSAENKFKLNLDSHYQLTEHAKQSNYLNVSVDNLTMSDFSEEHIAELVTDSDADNNSGLDRSMNLIANLIKNKANATIYNIGLGGFDTHIEQSAQHARLLKMLSKAIFSFQSDIEISGFADKVLILICSEFGRSYKENENFGTDHGYLNHVLAIGNGVKGGIYKNKNGQVLNNPANKASGVNLQTVALSWLACPTDYRSSFSISGGLGASAALSLGYSPI